MRVGVKWNSRNFYEIFYLKFFIKNVAWVKKFLGVNDLKRFFINSSKIPQKSVCPKTDIPTFLNKKTKYPKTKIPYMQIPDLPLTPFGVKPPFYPKKGNCGPYFRWMLSCLANWWQKIVPIALNLPNAKQYHERVKYQQPSTRHLVECETSGQLEGQRLEVTHLCSIV